MPPGGADAHTGGAPVAEHEQGGASPRSGGDRGPSTLGGAEAAPGAVAVKRAVSGSVQTAVTPRTTAYQVASLIGIAGARAHRPP